MAQDRKEQRTDTEASGSTSGQDERAACVPAVATLPGTTKLPQAPFDGARGFREDLQMEVLD